MSQRSSEFFNILTALIDGLPLGQGSNRGTKSIRDYQADCRRIVSEDVAVVSVKMASAVYTRSTRTVRMTLSEKIASFGKVLFGGFLTLVDL